MSNIFIIALIFGIWYTVLFYGSIIGLSMLLFVGPLTYYLIYILEKNNKIENSNAKLMIIPILLLSSTYFIFNNTFFKMLNIWVIPLLILIMIIWLFNEKMTFKTIIRRVFQLVMDPIAEIGETIRKIKNNIKQKFNLKVDVEKKSKLGKILKGILITVPIAIVIVALLSSADEIFGSLFSNVFEHIFDVLNNIHLSSLTIQIIITLAVFLYLASFFDNIITDGKEIESNILENKKDKDKTTIKMILMVLDIIYLIFCIIQIKSLFFKNLDINYAQYARQGFFQLMIVSCINLFMILIAKNNKGDNSEKSNKYINIMCLIMIAFTFIIIISAGLRMYLYESAYGYTLLRLLVYCVLITESLLLVPTVLYVIDKQVELVKIYIVIIVTMYVCMNFANFDNIIAKRNIDRYLETGKIDIYYLEKQTETDAVKQIMRLTQNKYKEDSEYTEFILKEARNYLQETYERLEYKNIDFRDFNISELNAKKLIEKINN